MYLYYSSSRAAHRERGPGYTLLLLLLLLLL